LANPRLNRSATFQVTLAACVLTLLNLVFPHVEHTNPATVANRVIAVMALVVTGALSDRTQAAVLAIQKGLVAAELLTNNNK
jgi:two-component system NarL family sensor kinase